MLFKFLINVIYVADEIHYLKKTASLFDAGGVKGLLLSNLGTQNDGEIVFNCEEKMIAFAYLFFIA